MDKKIRILGVSGSLRNGSFHSNLLKAAAELVPGDAEIEIADISGLPLFNQDLEKNMPAPVIEFKSKIKGSDAVLFATPEYNYSVSGVLKNAVDWASRPHGANAWQGKPVAIMSASSGMLGGARAQYHLRQVFVSLDMHPVNQPEVMVPFAQEKFDVQGNLTDEGTKEKIRQLLLALIAWTKKLNK